MIVCNRTGRDGESDMIDAESVIADRGVKLLTLQSPHSTVFVVDCLIRDGHIATCEVIATSQVTAPRRYCARDKVDEIICLGDLPPAARGRARRPAD